jgi:hypothetical protein
MMDYRKGDRIRVSFEATIVGPDDVYDGCAEVRSDAGWTNEMVSG